MKKPNYLILTLIGLGALFLTYQDGYFLADPAMAAECIKGDFKSPEKKVHLIELFTSEGCSSCPPAEKWISSLRVHKELGKTFFPLAFHVDYWDYIGWKDPLSKKSFSDRQRRYAKKWKSKRIYTPGFVKNGEEWKGLVVRSLPSASSKKVGVLKASLYKDNKLKINYSKLNKNYNLNLVLLGNNIISNVKAGENRGKKLKQYFAVLEHSLFKFKNDMIIKIPTTKIKAKEKMLAIWLEDPKNMEPIQVASGCL